MACLNASVFLSFAYVSEDASINFHALNVSERSFFVSVCINRLLNLSNQ